MIKHFDAEARAILPPIAMWLAAIFYLDVVPKDSIILIAVYLLTYILTGKQAKQMLLMGLNVALCASVLFNVSISLKGMPNEMHTVCEMIALYGSFVVFSAYSFSQGASFRALSQSRDEIVKDKISRGRVMQWMCAISMFPTAYYALKLKWLGVDMWWYTFITATILFILLGVVDVAEYKDCESRIKELDNGYKSPKE